MPTRSPTCLSAPRHLAFGDFPGPPLPSARIRSSISPADLKETDSQGWLVARFRLVAGNVALVGALLYAYVAYVGLVYCVALYWMIGINLINLFEPTDFLLAGLRHPIVLVLPVIFIGYYWCFSLVAFGRTKEVSSLSHRRHINVFMLGTVVFGVLPALLLPIGASYYVGLGSSLFQVGELARTSPAMR